VNLGLTAYPGLEDLVYVCPTPAPMQARQVLGDGPGPARRLRQLNDAYDLLVESDRRDAQLLIWGEETGPSHAIYAAVRGTRGPLRGFVTLARGGERTALAVADLAVAPNGHALAALWRFGTFGGPPNRVLVARRSPGARFGAPVALPRSETLAVPVTATGDGGQAAVAWADGSRVVVARGPGFRTRSVFRVRRPLSGDERVACEASGENCPDVDLAIDRRGSILVAWRERDAIRTARFVPR
jgi:hypothetical protein